MDFVIIDRSLKSFDFGTKVLLEENMYSNNQVHGCKLVICSVKCNEKSVVEQNQRIKITKMLNCLF